jgi:23S rRNA pseudouridine1911/1915/1917 synthase
MTPEPRTLEVRQSDRGARLDRFLAEQLKLSRSAVRRLLARGAVSIDGRRLGEGAKGRDLVAGEQVAVEPFARPEHEQALADATGAVQRLAEGPGWVALDKPAGMPVHPLRPDESGTLLNALMADEPQIQGVGEGGLRSGVVHRLDVDTSGAILFATREDRWEELRGAFREHRVHKHYRAIVLGHMEGEGRAEVGLLTARHRPARVRVVDADERERARGVRVGELHWRVAAPLHGATLLDIYPRTGHLHQIRVTFAHLGHPLAGDRNYGAPSDSTNAARHMLHAAHVRWGECEARSPDPPDFAALVEALKLSAS